MRPNPFAFLAAMILVPVLICLSIVANAGAHTGTPHEAQHADEQLVRATERFPRGSADGIPEMFVCNVEGHVVTVDRGVQLTWQGAGGRKTEVNIEERACSPSKCFIEKLWCGMVASDLLLLFRGTGFVNEGDFKMGGVLRLGPLGKSRWSVSLPGNVGDPLRVGRYLYVSGGGFVGKLDLALGRFLWQQKGFERSPGLFLSFEQPHREGARVVFPGRHYNLGRPIPETWPRAIVVDDESGRILEGTPNSVAQEQLKDLAKRVRASVVRGDAESLLGFLSDKGLSCVDYRASVGEVRAQLGKKTGHPYDTLFDTRQLQSRISSWGFDVPVDMSSFQDYFKRHPDCSLVIRGDNSAGEIQWQLLSEEAEMHSPRFEYRWDAKGNRYTLTSIGCN